MNGFQLKEYWRYWRAAKGRHGVHSPAVYRFVAEALRPLDRHFKNVPAYSSDSAELWQSDMLMRRVVHHFRFREIVVPSTDDLRHDIFRATAAIADDRSQETFDRLQDWRAIAPEFWLDRFKKDLGQLGRNDVIAVHGIHQSVQHAEAWRMLIGQPEVRLSIDLFRVGLLFFSEDFKERQHFVLKYPL